MITQNTECLEVNSGCLSNSSFGLSGCSSENFGTRNVGVCFQSPVPTLEGGLMQPNHQISNSASTILGHVGSPNSAFYVTECLMGFPEYQYRVGMLPWLSQLPKNYGPTISSCQNSEDPFSVNSAKGDNRNLQSRDTLHSDVKLPLCHNQNLRFSNVSDRIPCRNLPGSELPPLTQNKVVGEDVTLNNWQPSIPLQENQNHRVGCNSFTSPIARPSFHLQPDKQSPRPSGAAVSSKTRIKWTQELHEKFVNCVNHLGGAEKATPKAILKLMDSEGLTIFHVKSHLQKYRTTKYIQSAEEKSDKKTCMNDITRIDTKSGMQIMETLRLQLDVQRCLHEQLEIQQNLQMQIEEQGRQLKIIFNQQQKKNKSLFQIQNLDIMSADENSTSLEDIQVSSVGEGSENTHFHSQIS